MSQIKHDNAEARIVRENGSIFIKSAGSTIHLSSSGVLLREVQDIFQIDLGYRGLEPKAQRLGNNLEECPYCGSMGTIGNGTRTTQKEIQNRRICKSCNRTYAAGKVYPKLKEDPTKLKGKIQLLSMCQFNALEISQRLDMSLPYIVEYLNTTKDNTIKKPNGFTFAKPFDISKIIPDNLGKTRVWEYNGSLALKRAGSPNIIFIKKTDKELMEHFSNEQLTIYLSKVPAKKRDIIEKYIDYVLDYKLGIIPRTYQETRPKPDCGDIDPAVFDEGQEKASSEPVED